jgi:tRNA(fMet)-specific endonuclease VapC
MTRLMLDTNVCIDAMRGRAPEIRRRLERIDPADTAVSSMVAAELWTGVMKSRNRGRAADAVRALLGFVNVLDWPADAAVVYAEIRARLESAGRSIGAMDLLIAAHAIHEMAILVTRNLAEFRRVEGLKLETWG